jgi:hypothetical protein
LVTKGEKAMTRKLALAFSSAVLVLASASVVSAQTWSAAGLTGIVDEADLSIHRFNDTGSVSIKSSVASGTLNLRFPVGTFHWVPQEGDCPELRANLRDTGAGARVIVRLMRLGIGGEALIGELTSVATIDSDRFPSAASTRYISHRACLNGEPSPIVDVTYYVDVQLIKTSGTANPGLMSLQICPSQDFCDP